MTIKLPPLPEGIGCASNLYTADQLRTAQREAALMALDAAIDKVALYGGSVEIEAAIRTLRTELGVS